MRGISIESNTLIRSSLSIPFCSGLLCVMVVLKEMPEKLIGIYDQFTEIRK